ncbi:MAG: hypothetical protein GC160_15290 [Acidobacteria bacterium]|nr:hypothetical protein [Acidobacteriota bacterium]
MYREPVLGDLEERFQQRAPGLRWYGYVGDVATTVPQVLRSQLRRIIVRGPACAAAAGDLRRRAEHLQTQVWLRNVALLVGSVVVIGAFLANAQGDWHFQETVHLAMTIGWVGAVWRSYGIHGRSTGVPASMSLDELREFHRRELTRQMNVGVGQFWYWSAPAAFLILYAWIAAVPDFRGAGSLLAAIVMQNCVIVWASRKERSVYQRELDPTEQGAAKA